MASDVNVVLGSWGQCAPRPLLCPPRSLQTLYERAWLPRGLSLPVRGWCGTRGASTLFSHFEASVSASGWCPLGFFPRLS